MLKQVITGLSALLLVTVPFSSARAAVLAKIEADVDGSGVKKVVELTGDKKIPGSNYYSDLWIMIRNKEGKMVSAWKSDLEGGYHCLLEKMPVNQEETGKVKKEKKKKISQEEKAEQELKDLIEALKEETDKTGKKEKSEIKISDKPHDQILLLAAKGGKNGAVGCRILDFSGEKKVKEVFSGADALGITAQAKYMPDFRFQVTCELPESGKEPQTLSFSGKAGNILHLYRDDGSIAKTYLQPHITEVASLTRLDGKLFTEQNILAADQRSLLGRLAVRWGQADGKWNPEEVTLVDTPDELQEDTANQTDGAGKWKIYPRRAFIGDRSISRPVVAIEEQPDLQNKINKTLQDWFENSPEEEERAFQVKFAGPDLLSLELGRRNRKGEVIRTLYNFNMKTGENLKLGEMFDTKNPDFVKVLNLTGKPGDAFATAKPAFWHYTGKFYVIQDRLLAEDFQDEEAIHMATVAAEDMKPFLKDKTLVENEKTD